MNAPYPIPGAQVDANSFFADNTLVLGTLDQPLDARTLVSIDYSKLIPATSVVNYSFRVKPGGEPQLSFEDSDIDTAGVILSFYVRGGIGGTQYTVQVMTTLDTGEIRSDTLYVNVQGDGCCCTSLLPRPTFTDETDAGGMTIVNRAPRFFVSATPPVGANVLDRWYNVTTDQVFDFITNGVATSWRLAGGGGGGGGTMRIVRMQPIVPDGVAVTFTLIAVDLSAVSVVNSEDLFVSQDGVWQQGPVQYAAGGNRITFNSAPAPDASIFMVWFAPPLGGL
jgi:hypothetical protein